MRKRTEDSLKLKNLDDADVLPTFAQKRKKMYETVAHSAIRNPRLGGSGACPLALINDGLNADFHDYLIGNNRYSAVYMHEYGHYIQSQITGPLCLPIVDSYSFIQSIIKNGTYQIYKGKRVHRSNFGWTEIWANRLSSSYFWEHEGLDWCGLGYDTNFPIDWSACN